LPAAAPVKQHLGQADQRARDQNLAQIPERPLQSDVECLFPWGLVEVRYTPSPAISWVAEAKPEIQKKAMVRGR